MCENDFLETETKHNFKKRTFAATMIRLGRLPDSNTARKLSASAFLHSLDPKRPFKSADANVRYPIAKRSFDCPAQLGS